LVLCLVLTFSHAHMNRCLYIIYTMYLHVRKAIRVLGDRQQVLFCSHKNLEQQQHSGVPHFAEVVAREVRSHVLTLLRGRTAEHQILSRAEAAERRNMQARGVP
jgi:hypothetical protein